MDLINWSNALSSWRPCWSWIQQRGSLPTKSSLIPLSPLSYSRVSFLQWPDLLSLSLTVSPRHRAWTTSGNCEPSGFSTNIELDHISPSIALSPRHQSWNTNEYCRSSASTTKIELDHGYLARIVAPRHIAGTVSKHCKPFVSAANIQPDHGSPASIVSSRLLDWTTSEDCEPLTSCSKKSSLLLISEIWGT